MRSRRGIVFDESSDTRPRCKHSKEGRCAPSYGDPWRQDVSHELMKHQPKVISSPISGFRLDPTFTSEETIILRALVGGKTDKQVCNLLRMSSNLFLRLMRDLREKTGTTSNLSLLVWAQRRMKSGDRRAVDRQERYARPARIEGISEQRNRGVGKVGG